MAVITISREIGSEGSSIARQVAQALNYPLVDKRTIEAVLNQYGLVQFRKEYESAPGFWDRFDAERERIIKMLNQSIRAMAHHGDVVILGRGSFAVLNDFADVLNVRIQAPFPVRVERVAKRQNITEPEKAEAVVQESDNIRTIFIQSWYGTRWDTTDAFDVVIDTGKIPPELAVTWIVQAHDTLKEKQDSKKPTTDTIQVNPILAETVTKEIQF